MDRRPSRGKMLWFNEEKGHGFIATDDGERLYVDVQGFAESPPVGSCAGLDVEFLLANGPQGNHAEATRIVTTVSPRRARLRHSR
jgi:cold shock CspA family protein